MSKRRSPRSTTAGACVVEAVRRRHPAVKADSRSDRRRDGVVYLLASNGTLYEFREGEERRARRLHDVRHAARQGMRVRGPRVRLTINSLLLACKHVEYEEPEGRHGDLPVEARRSQHELSRTDACRSPTSPHASARKATSIRRTSPSIPSRQLHAHCRRSRRRWSRSRPTGSVVFARKLPGDHDQPESRRDHARQHPDHRRRGDASPRSSRSTRGRDDGIAHRSSRR